MEIKMKYKSLVLEKYPDIKCSLEPIDKIGYICFVIDENNETTYLSEGATPANAWRECWAYIIRDENNPYWKRDNKIADEEFKEFLRNNPGHIKLTKESVNKLCKEVLDEFND